MIASSKFFNSKSFDISTMVTTFNSELIDLVRDIEKAAEAKGLTLSRWQTNHGSHACTVRYALHTGERTSQMRLQDGAVSDIELSGLEGKTRRCAAYKALAKMATDANLWY